MAFIIEMAGIPGAGKTTLQNALVAELAELGLLVPNSVLAIDRRSPLARAAKQIRYVRTAFQHRRALSIAARSMRAGGRPWAQQVQVIRFLTVTFDRHRRIRDHESDGVAVLDEGVLQRCFLVFVEATGAYPSNLREFLRYSPAPDGVVLLQPDPTQALQRTQHRQRGMPPRMVGLSPPEAVDVLEAGARLLADATDYVSEDHGAEVFRIGPDESTDIGRVAARFAEAARCPIHGSATARAESDGES